MAGIVFDPADPALRRNPYPTYRQMREESPVWRSPQGVERIFKRFPDLALSADEEPEFRPHLTVRGFARLPVTL